MNLKQLHEETDYFQRRETEEPLQPNLDMESFIRTYGAYAKSFWKQLCKIDKSKGLLESDADDLKLQMDKFLFVSNEVVFNVMSMLNYLPIYLFPILKEINDENVECVVDQQFIRELFRLISGNFNDSRNSSLHKNKLFAKNKKKKTKKRVIRSNEGSDDSTKQSTIGSNNEGLLDTTLGSFYRSWYEWTRNEEDMTNAGDEFYPLFSLKDGIGKGSLENYYSYRVKAVIGNWKVVLKNVSNQIIEASQKLESMGSGDSNSKQQDGDDEEDDDDVYVEEVEQKKIQKSCKKHFPSIVKKLGTLGSSSTPKGTLSLSLPFIEEWLKASRLLHEEMLIQLFPSQKTLFVKSVFFPLNDMEQLTFTLKNGREYKITERSLVQAVGAVLTLPCLKESSRLSKMNTHVEKKSQYLKLKGQGNHDFIPRSL